MTHVAMIIVYISIDNATCVSSSSVINAAIVHQRALTITDVRTRNRRQYIYPDIKFSCNGTITKWIYGAEAIRWYDTSLSYKYGGVKQDQILIQNKALV